MRFLFSKAKISSKVRNRQNRRERKGKAVHHINVTVTGHQAIWIGGWCYHVRSNNDRLRACRWDDGYLRGFPCHSRFYWWGRFSYLIKRCSDLLSEFAELCAVEYHHLHVISGDIPCGWQRIAQLTSFLIIFWLHHPKNMLIVVRVNWQEQIKI